MLASDGVVFQWEDEQLIAGRAVVLGTQRIGAVSVGLPTAPLAAKLDAVRMQGVIVAAAAAIVGLFLTRIVSRSITDPIHHLIDATDEITAGHLAQRVVVNGHDELATLGHRFNQMTARLEQTLSQMELDQERKRQVAELDAFAHTVAHDLKSPLTLIVGFSDLRNNFQRMSEAERETALHRIEKSAYLGHPISPKSCSF